MSMTANFNFKPVVRNQTTSVKSNQCKVKMSNFPFKHATIFLFVIATVKTRPVLKTAWQGPSREKCTN